MKNNKHFEKKVGTKVNFLYNMLYQIILMILPLISMPYITRILGPEELGIYSYTYSIAQYFLLFAVLGIDTYGNRNIAMFRDDKEKMSKFFSELYALQVICALLSFFIYIIYIFFFCSEHKIYFLIQTFYLFSALFDVNWFFFGLENFKLTVGIKIIIKIINFVSIFVFVKTEQDLWKYLFILSLGYFLAQSSLYYKVFNYVKFIKIEIKEVFKHFNSVLILFIPTLAKSVYRMMDKVMLGSLTGMEEVGYYEGAEKLINICLYVISAFSAVMLPRMANLVANKKYDEFNDLFDRSMELAMFIACAITFGIASISADFVPIFYGKNYESTIIITILLSFSVIFITWANIYRTMFLIPCSQDKIYVISVITGASINIIANYFLISKHGAIGAAIGTIIAEVTVALFQTILVGKKVHLKYCLKKSIPFIVFGIIMYVVLNFLSIKIGNEFIKLVIKIFLGMVVYISLSFSYFYHEKNKVFFDIYNKITNLKNIKK